VQSAEAHLQTLAAAPSTFLPGLVEVAKTHEQQQFRQMAVVLLRRNLNQVLLLASCDPHRACRVLSSHAFVARPA
jgi:hypothetical protein